MDSYLSPKSSLYRLLIVSCISIQVLGVPLPDSDEVGLSILDDYALNSTNTSDTEILKGLGVNETFIHQLEVNLEKAILEEKTKQGPNNSIDQDRLRQGGIGDFYGVGGGNNGNGGNGNGGFQNGGEGEEDDEEDAPPAAAGPGPFGVLTGLFGLFSGLGTLSPRRVLQSTVNFFPPDQRIQAQMALDMIFGIEKNDTKIGLPPTTNAPTAIKSNSTMNSDVLNSTDINNNNNSTEASLTAKGVVDEAELMPEMVKATTSRYVVVRKSTKSTTKKPSEPFNEGDEDIVEEPIDKIKTPSLEKEFAETASKLTTTPPKSQDNNGKLKGESIEKHFVETGAKLTVKI